MNTNLQAESLARDENTRGADMKNRFAVDTPVEAGVGVRVWEHTRFGRTHERVVSLYMMGLT